MAQQKAALQGNTHAQRDVLRAARELEERDRLREQQEQLERRETFLHMRKFRDERARLWAEAKREGTEPAEPWPHPDDIIMYDGNDQWRLRGPLDERDVPFCRYIRAERDWHFSSMILGARRAKTRAKRRVAVSLHSFWACYDVMVPPRWQISGPGVDQLITLFWLFPIADLKADVHRYNIERRALKPLSFEAKHDRDSYKFANDIMKPFLRRQGYRSLAEFERAYETLGPHAVAKEGLVVRPAFRRNALRRCTRESDSRPLLDCASHRISDAPA